MKERITVTIDKNLKQWLKIYNQNPSLLINTLLVQYKQQETKKLIAAYQEYTNDRERNLEIKEWEDSDEIW